MPRIIYKDTSGKRLPSVTTILSNVGWSKDGLIRWAHKMGTEGVDLDEARKKAADVGSTVHLMIKADLRGEALDISGLPDDMQDKARTAFEAWEEWKQRNPLQVLSSEGSLTSDALGFGGTHDLVYRSAHTEKTTLLDFKAANGIYPDHLLQIAAYGELWDEHNPANPIERYELIRLGKEEGDFHDHHWRAESLQPARDGFRAALELHNAHKSLRSLT